MMAINMRREKLQYLDNESCQHAGLLLDRGFEIWTDEHNQAIVNLHHQASKIEFSELYRKAYEQWYQHQLNNLETCAIWLAELESRLFLGMGTASPLEAGISLHHTYGVPYIPGTAIKGVLHHYAQTVGISDAIQHVLFGQQASQTDRRECGEAGYIIFNDGWWIPEGQALVPEIITVHHQDYYGSQGEKPATDFDSPNPNPQIAIQGSFMFSLEGESQWVQYAIALLKKALMNRGIGAKTSSGYGYFRDNLPQQKSFDKEREAMIERSLSPEKRLQHKIDKLTLEQLPQLFGKGRANTSKDIGQEYWLIYLKLIQDKFSNNIREWETSKDKFEKRAYKTIYGHWLPDWDADQDKKNVES